MKAVTIKAGSTPGEKEKGRWMKLTPSEIREARRVLGMKRYGNNTIWGLLDKLDEEIKWMEVQKQHEAN